uniref:ABC transporter permease n=1 Tax=Steinernema glaseri TaxID=37863 RepID=A0A1I7Y4J5_9BILA
AYQAEVAQRAAENGVIEAIERKGDMARVTLRDESGAEQVLNVEQASLQMDRGDDVAEGDLIGVTHQWAAGPLAWGLFTTFNPTLRDLSTVYVELVRGTPLLVQIFIFYFFIGTVLNLSREFAGVAALALRSEE